MERNVERVEISRTSVSEQNVWETGIGSDVEKNCVLRVKKIQSLYQGKAQDASAPEREEPVAVTRKGKGKRRHREEKETAWTKKVHRTRSSVGEEEETITLNLRKADTVIDVSIKSPVKRKKSSRRHRSGTNASNVTGRQRSSQLQGMTSSSTHAKEGKSPKSAPTSIGGGTVMLSQGDEAGQEGDGEGQETTTMLASPRRSNAKGEGVKKCLHGALDIVPTATMLQDTGKEVQVPTTSVVVESGLSPVEIGVGPSTAELGGQSKLDIGVGLCSQNLSPVSLVASEVGRSAEMANSNVTPFSFPNAIVESVDAGQHEVAVNADATQTFQLEVQEFPAEDRSEAPHEEGSPEVPHPVRRDEHEEQVINTEEISLNPNRMRSKSKAQMTTATDVPDAAGEVTSPKSPVMQQALKPCQLTVAACLKNIRDAKERSRSPSPLPPQSPPMASPRMRPPRPTVCRQQAALPAMKLVPVLNGSKEVEVWGTSPEDVKRSLDTLLNQLLAEEVAKYFSRKAQVSFRKPMCKSFCSDVGKTCQHA